MRRMHWCIVASTVAIVLVVVGTADHAGATAYAVSSDTVGMKFGGAEVFSRQTSNATNKATWSGFGTDEASAPLDPRQAKSGPGPFPGENSFVPQGRVGQYARGDSVISATSILDMGGSNIAEVYRAKPGSAEASALMAFNFGLRQVTADPIAISLTAVPFMEVSTTLPLETAFARLFFQVTFQDFSTGTTEFTWTPSGDPLSDFSIASGVVTDVKDPFSLNTSISCGDGPCGKTYGGEVGDFAISYRRAQGQEYLVKVLWSERARVDAVKAVPEPSSGVLLLIAVMGALGVAHSVTRRSRSDSLEPC